MSRETQSKKNKWWLVVSPSQNPEWGSRAKKWGGAREQPDTTETAPCGTQEGPTGEVSRSVSPDWECCFPDRAVEPSGKLLAHRSKDRMSVSGLCTRVPVRVWSAVADTPQSNQAVSCGSRQRLKGRPRPEQLFSPSGVRRASALESPCQAPVVGRHRVTGGSGVTLSP